MGPPTSSWLNKGFLHPSETEDRGLPLSSAPCSGWSLCPPLQSYWGNREDSGISWKDKCIRYYIINTGLPSKVSSPLAYTLYIKLHSVQLLSPVWLFATPWITARQASLSTTNSWSWPRLMCIEWVMLSCHLILCRPLLLLPLIPPRIRVFSNESALRMRWPKYWSFSLSISPSSEHPGLGSFRMNYVIIIQIHVTLEN